MEQQEIIVKLRIDEQPEKIIRLAVDMPLMHPDKFAVGVGVTEGVVGGWIDNAYVPTVKVGKYRLINMVLLVENLKAGVLV
jgi:hypothetical protein